LATASVDVVAADVRLVVILAFRWPALGVNLGAECEQAIPSRLAFRDLELDAAISGAESENV
jgi:hypothetical protein